MRLGYLVAGLLVVLTPALAHDERHLSNWIAQDGLRDPLSLEYCCGVNDCHVTVAVSIRREGYWLTDTNELVVFRRAIRNKRDSNYWRCDKTFQNGSKEVRCLIVPPPST